MRAALIAFTEPIALRSMQGIWTSPRDRIAGEAEVVLHADLGGILDLPIAAAERRHQPACGHRAGDADLTLAAHLRTGDRCVLLVEDADRSGREQEHSRIPPRWRRS
jgi:hypothetical protein